jgi:hypothetical protein
LFIKEIKNILSVPLFNSLSKKKNTKKIITDEELLKLKLQLKNHLTHQTSNPTLLIGKEKEIVQSIRNKTDAMNVNNITRTNAYLKYYQRNPEVHWAFLAHMVSRNAGWNMTDIKGDIVGDLIPEKNKVEFFTFLERSNALIFSDAYPQLLLYEYSKHNRKAYFHLLKSLHVSSFMHPIWNYFFLTKNSSLLTVALIINEQNYIEKRVIRNQQFKEVLNSIQFRMQDLFGFTMVLFPYLSRNKKNKVKLAGITAKDFTSLSERVEIGKRLYSILFEVKQVYKGAHSFSLNTPHTGSREDFYPTIFSKHLNPSSDKIYSPTLTHVWSNIHHKYHDKSDWFIDLMFYKDLQTIPVSKKYDVTDEYNTKLITLFSIENIVNLF